MITPTEWTRFKFEWLEQVMGDSGCDGIADDRATEWRPFCFSISMCISFALTMECH
jgi:hypothetical protein